MYPFYFQNNLKFDGKDKTSLIDLNLTRYARHQTPKSFLSKKKLRKFLQNQFNDKLVNKNKSYSKKKGSKSLMAKKGVSSAKFKIIKSQKKLNRSLSKLSFSKQLMKPQISEKNNLFIGNHKMVELIKKMNQKKPKR